MVLVTRSLVPGGLECILLGAFCRLRWREKLRTAARCDHWKYGKRRGLQRMQGPPAKQLGS